MNDEIKQSLTLFNIVFIVAGAIVIFLIFIFLSRSITVPLRNLINTAHELAEGNIYAETPQSALQQKTEIGLLAHAVNDMSLVYQDMIMSTERLFNAANIGKLEVRNDVTRYKGDIQKVIRQINDTLDATTQYLNSIPEIIFIMSKDQETYFRNKCFIDQLGDISAAEFMEYVSKQEEHEVWIGKSCYWVLIKTIELDDLLDDSILVVAREITNLIKEREKVQAATEAKSDFLSRMSHEMRTPMNAIIGMTKIAERTEEVERLKHCLATIETSSVHLLGIINDVLDISKIEAGKFELDSKPMNIEKMLKKVCNIVKDNMEKKNQFFVVDIDKEMEMNYVTDELRMSQVITNFLSNAVKFTPEYGKITLSVKKTGNEENENTIRFSVSDTGIGLTREQISRLFKPYEQADKSITGKYGGTGLGLAISKNIVEKMGGRIWAESAPGSGAVFSFEVRLRLAAEQTKKDLKEVFNIKTGIGKVVPDFSNVHILLVEDMEINREIFIALLEDTGIKIDTAENGRIAVSKFVENQDLYDLIIMDVQMPDMNGYQATQTIRSLNLPRAKTIPIIAMTANAFKEDVERCIESGMNDHLPKPIDEKLVIEKINEFINHA